MENIARRRRASYRRGCRRNNRKQRGGTAGSGYTFGGPVSGDHVINNYDGTVVRYPSCNEATRPGYIADAQIKGGLPGFGGGARHRRKSHRKGSRKGKGSRRQRGGVGAPFPASFASETTTVMPQANGPTVVPQPVPGATNVTTTMRGGRGGVLETGANQLSAQMGGRYTNEFAPIPGGIGALMEPRYSGCGDGALALPDALNKVQATSLITAPPAQVPLPTPLKGGRRKGSRRATRRRAMYGGVGGVDSMFYEAPRAGYTTWPSNAQGGDAGTLSDGKTPFLINVPYSAQPTPSQACLKTGGRRKGNHKSSRKSRKSKGSRKNRR